MPEAMSIDAEAWEITLTGDWISRRSFQRVALQLPDDLLHASPALVAELKQRLPASTKVYVLADATYNPLGVDEVAAQHMAADCVVHYGRASLAPVMQLPALFVLPRSPLDCTTAAHALQTIIQESVTEQRAAAVPLAAVLILVDQAYQHALPQLRAALQDLSARAPVSLVFAETAARSLEPLPTGGGGGNAMPSSSSPATPSPAAASQACGCSLVAGGRQGTAATCFSGTTTAPHVNKSACCASAQLEALSQPPAAGQAGVTSVSSDASSAATPGAGTGSNTGAQVADPAASAATNSRPAQGAGASSSVGLASTTSIGGGDSTTTSHAATITNGGNRTTDAIDANGRGPTSGAAAAAVGTSMGTDIIGESTTTGTRTGDSDATGTSSSSNSTVCGGLRWTLPPGVDEASCLMLWLGPPDVPSLQVLQLTRSRCFWRAYDPASGTRSSGILPETARLLKRRYYLVEKARSATIIGILVGTLSTAGFVGVVDRLRELARLAGKKTYTLLMGKPSPAKLANFPEVEVFVMVADPQGFLLDSREYLAPVVTPFEAELAFRGLSLSPDYYSLDFNYRLEGFRDDDDDGEDMEDSDPTALIASGNRQQLQLRGDRRQHLSVLREGGGGAVAMARDAADYLLHKRTHQGLETPLTGAAPAAVGMAVAGRSGRAAGYTDEPSTTV